MQHSLKVNEDLMRRIQAERNQAHRDRDEAEDRFVQAREENSGLEQEVADLTGELVLTRAKLAAKETEATTREDGAARKWALFTFLLALVVAVVALVIAGRRGP